MTGVARKDRVRTRVQGVLEFYSQACGGLCCRRLKVLCAVDFPGIRRALLQTSGGGYPFYRLLSMNAASCDFDSAPSVVASMLPFLNSISVGMLRTP